MRGQHRARLVTGILLLQQKNSGILSSIVGWDLAIEPPELDNASKIHVYIIPMNCIPNFCHVSSKVLRMWAWAAFCELTNTSTEILIL